CARGGRLDGVARYLVNHGGAAAQQYGQGQRQQKAAVHGSAPNSCCSTVSHSVTAASISVWMTATRLWVKGVTAQSLPLSAFSMWSSVGQQKAITVRPHWCAKAIAAARPSGLSPLQKVMRTSPA